MIVPEASGVEPNAPVETKTCTVAESLPCPSAETFTAIEAEVAPGVATTDAITGGV